MSRLDLSLLVTVTLLHGCATAADDRLTQPLAPAGDVQRGKRLVLEREKGHCVLCHALPEPEAKFAGNLGPPLHGVGARFDVAQLRARLVDASRQNPATIMPAYFRTQGLNRVASAYVGKPILTAQEIEDVVAYLASLK